MSLPVTLVYNPKSGSAVDLPTIKKLCAQFDITIQKSIAIQDDVAKALQGPIKHGSTVMTIGGDGTLSFVAGQLAGTRAVLLPLPGGTLNNFTKDLGVPQTLEAALAKAVTAKPRSIDIASVNDTYFINNSSLGLYPQSLHTRKRFEDRIGKWPAAIVAIARAFLVYRSYAVSIGTITFKTPFIFVGNNPYTLNGFDLPRRTAINKGILSVFVIRASSRMGLIRLFASATSGRLKVDSSFQEFSCNEFTISSKKHKRLHVSRDGELAKLTLPLTYKIHAKALRVRC